MRVGFRIAGAVLVVGATAVAADARATDLDAYAGILDRHTRAVESAVGTQVDYDALRHSSEWPALVASLEASDPSQLRSVAQKLAF